MQMRTHMHSFGRLLHALSHFRLEGGGGSSEPPGWTAHQKKTKAPVTGPPNTDLGTTAVTMAVGFTLKGTWSPGHSRPHTSVAPPPPPGPTHVHSPTRPCTRTRTYPHAHAHALTRSRGRCPARRRACPFCPSAVLWVVWAPSGEPPRSWPTRVWGGGQCPAPPPTSQCHSGPDMAHGSSTHHDVRCPMEVRGPKVTRTGHRLCLGRGGKGDTLCRAAGAIAGQPF